MANQEKKNKFPNQSYVFYSLTKRHLLVFFKNIPTVIFTLMVPLAILLVYIIFLRQLETSSIKTSLDAMIQESTTSSLQVGSAEYNEILKKVYGIADCWMVAGVLAVSCITVSLNANYIVVRDKESLVTRDFVSSPIHPNIIVASYFTFNVIVTFLVNFIVYLVCLLILNLYGAYMISLVDFFSILGVLFLSTISASLITFFICSFIKSESVMSPVVAIVSAGVGFLIGAYLPSNFGPKYIGYITTFFPGTYSVGLLRNFFMKTPLSLLSMKLETYGMSGLVDTLGSQFSLNIDFFGTEVNPGIMVLVLFISIAIFAVLNLLFSNHNFFRLNLTLKKKRKENAK
jgi:multidrug/hemolysin transport system permease protein